jgi:hypothetical protein
MKTVFIHIGYNKTGTTAIQHFCSNNRSVLKQKYGLLYPNLSDEGISDVAHHLLSHSLLFHSGSTIPYYHSTEIYRMHELDYFWDMLISEIEGNNCDKVLISSEAFSRLRRNTKELVYIKSKLKKFNIKIVIYLRNQVEYFESTYNQGVKAGTISTSKKSFINHLCKSINYLNEIDQWSSVFGVKNVIVKGYSKEKLKDGIIPEFFNTIGVVPPYELIYNRKDVNTKLPNELIPIKRVINAINRKHILSNKKINHYLLFLAPFLKTKSQLFNHDEKERIRMKYLESNIELERTYNNGDKLF